MLKLRNDKKDQITIYEAILPKEMFELDDELKKVDQLLDDDSFFEPFTKRFSTRTGRNIESYLRLKYLKHRFNMGYETLVKEVSDSIKQNKLSVTTPCRENRPLSGTFAPGYLSDGRGLKRKPPYPQPDSKYF